MLTAQLHIVWFAHLQGDIYQALPRCRNDWDIRSGIQETRIDAIGYRVREAGRARRLGVWVVRGIKEGGAPEAVRALHGERTAMEGGLLGSMRIWISPVPP